ncbi:(Fe-S)-binding protein [Maribrevibacterium harenarium]|uniref:(Fe-S)-binding protein n=1 Tax=Maribrevibacterium harenarium TaxID=2589817 RepID=A0A501WLC6_9GAMM|nr:(Fe-S)-binding protein [Maribrevibacterium harenarium]TPE49200.1 (Fe-S)-binding protein [Maribrevibacterium harenarium]
MNVSFFATCICDALSTEVAKQTVLLLEQLGCRVHFPVRQTCCGQPAINSGYASQSLAAIKVQIAALEENDFPLICPAGSCTAMIHGYPKLLQDEPAWQQRAQDLSDRTFELTQFLVHHLDTSQLNAKLEGIGVYHPSCSLSRKLGIKEEPIILLKQVGGLTLAPFPNQETCCGFGGTFSVKMAEISGAMVTEKAEHIQSVTPDFLIGADASCLMNIGGRLRREGSTIRVMHIAEVLMSR